jgi:hypothetical protein
MSTLAYSQTFQATSDNKTSFNPQSTARQEKMSAAEEEQETRNREELSSKLHNEKLRTLNCLPLSQFQANSIVTYNSYNALLNLLEKSKSNLSEASQYAFKGLFL